MRFEIGRTITAGSAMFRIDSIDSHGCARGVDSAGMSWTVWPDCGWRFDEPPAPRLPKPGETWRFTGMGALANNFRIDSVGAGGGVLVTGDCCWEDKREPVEHVHTIEEIVRDATLVSEAPPAQPFIPKPKPRAHDFSNPYLCRQQGEVRLCVECGLPSDDAPKQCEPIADWRENHDRSMAAQMFRREMRARMIPRCPASHRPDVTYRNDVAGIGAQLGGYLNVAPERGR